MVPQWYLNYLGLVVPLLACAWFTLESCNAAPNSPNFLVSEYTSYQSYIQDSNGVMMVFSFALLDITG